MPGPFAPEDARRHDPTPGVGNWQESVLVSWYDAVAGAGGYHHADLQTSRDRACLWSWTAVDGEVAARSQSLNLPLPAGDLDDLAVGPWRLRMREGFSTYSSRVEHPDGAVEDVDLVAFTAPLHHAMAETGEDTGHSHHGPTDYSSPGTGHYELFGRVTGHVHRPDGTSRPVRAWGFLDHSWGPRTYGAVGVTHRWVHMAFGDDLYASLYVIGTDDDVFRYGYLVRDGRVHRVDDLDVEVTIDLDGHTPRRCAGVLRDRAGRAFSFRGDVHVSSVSTQDGGFFSTDGHGEFRLGDRVGSGLLAVRERSGPSARHRAWLEAHDDGVAG